MTTTAPDRPATSARLSRLVPLVLGLGLGVGALTQVLQGVLDDPWAAWANSVAVWCLVAFVVGAVAATPRRAVPAAVAALGLMLVGYYGAARVDGYTSRAAVVAVWAAGALVGGVVFGLAGAWWRRRTGWRAVVGTALPVAVLVEEGLLRHQRFPWQGAAGVSMVVLGAVLAVALPRTVRQRLVVLVAAAVLVPLGFGGDAVLNGVLGG